MPPPEPGPGATPVEAVDEVLNTAPCGFLCFADDGRVVLVNQTLLEMLGYDREELVGRHVERILTIGSRIFYQTHWFPLLRMHGRAEEIFLMLRDKSGQDQGMLVNAQRRNRDGATLYDCVLIRVRERQKYEDELLRARRAADQARAELEVQKEELQQANENLENQAIELEMQHQQLREQAEELEITGEELRVINETLMERSDELERARAAADEANRAKSTFLAVMSHELRTPLNAIAGYVELLEMGIHGPVTDAQQEALGRVKRSQRHLLRLINDVLNLARIEAGRVDYEVEDLALVQLIEEVSPMVEPQLTAKELSFESSVGPDLVVRADREKVQQVLLNLLSNAIKFTPHGGRITVAAAGRDDAPQLVFVRVTDTGIGIPPEKLESVFEPFVQVDVSASGRREGTGLGLAISRDLARGMGGDLRARSVVGEGSTFTLMLPRAGHSSEERGARSEE